MFIVDGASASERHNPDIDGWPLFSTTATCSMIIYDILSNWSHSLAVTSVSPVCVCVCVADAIKSAIIYDIK